jgi:hypothetical protein
LLAALPEHARQQARHAYELFLKDESHPGLRFKQVHNPPPTYSVRIGLNYRAVGVLRDDIIVWFWVGTHAEYDKLLAKR